MKSQKSIRYPLGYTSKKIYRYFLIQFIIIELLLIINCANAQNFWVQTNGPFGGSINCLAYKSNGSIFCGTSGGGGIYKSTNNGDSWFKVYDLNSANVQISDISIDINGNIYAAGTGILKSSDDGNSWIQLSNMTTYCIAVKTNGHLFAANYDRLFRSTNGGALWDTVYLSPNDPEKIIIGNTGNIYCVFVGLNVVMSTNDGSNWQSITNGIYGGTDLSMDLANNLLTANVYGIYRTSNNGLNWQHICNIQNMCSISGGSINEYYAGTFDGQIFKSNDYGMNWNLIFESNSYGSASWVRRFMIGAHGTIMAGMFDLGIIRTTDNGTSWDRINSGITNQITTDIGYNNGKLFCGTFKDGLFMSTNSGNTWNQAGLANKYVSAVGFNSTDNVYAYAIDSGYTFYRSTNGGFDWTSLGHPFTYTWVNNIKGIGNVLLVATNAGCKRSIDNGLSWSSIPFFGTVRRIEKNSTGELFALTDTSVYYSVDTGIVWTRSAAFPYGMEFMAISPYNSYIYVSGNSGNLYRSTNTGANWSIVNNNAFFMSMVVNSDDVIFGSRPYAGVFRSTNQGITWDSVNTGLLSNLNVTSLALDQLEYLYCGIWGSGVFKSAQSTVGLLHSGEQLPLNYKLSQNYPNPFNPTTKIKFDIPANARSQTSNVKLIIYDLLGREIAKLVGQQMQPGSYSVTWDGTNYPSGVYFYKLEAGDYSQTKKMVLIK